MSENNSGKASKRMLDFSSLGAQKLIIFATLIVLIIIFAVLSPNFLLVDNIISILLATCVNGLLALGVTFVIITGGIDLSIGTVMTFSAVISGLCVTNLNLPLWLGLIICILVGTIIGALTGLMVARLKIPAFIATLGVMMITSGLSLVVTGARPIYFPSEYKEIAVGSIFGKLIPGFKLPNAVLILF